jgi:hypothetical protein
MSNTFTKPLRKSGAFCQSQLQESQEPSPLHGSFSGLSLPINTPAARPIKLNVTIPNVKNIVCILRPYPISLFF